MPPFRCQILRLKCPKFDFRWGSAPADPTAGAYSAPPDPLAKRSERRPEGERKERKRVRRTERICRTSVKLLPGRLHNQCDAARALACTGQRNDVTRYNRIDMHPHVARYMTSSVRPEIHNISQCRQSRTKRRSWVKSEKKHLVKIGRVVPEICSRTDRQTDT